MLDKIVVLGQIMLKKEEGAMIFEYFSAPYITGISTS
jgi:hypothetical protein